jgi:hypothetical protein
MGLGGGSGDDGVPAEQITENGHRRQDSVRGMVWQEARNPAHVNVQVCGPCQGHHVKFEEAGRLESADGVHWL